MQSTELQSPMTLSMFHHVLACTHADRVVNAGSGLHQGAYVWAGSIGLLAHCP
jgi:hypothetical protein